MTTRLLIDRAAVLVTAESLAAERGLVRTGSGGVKQASMLIEAGRITAIEAGEGAQALLSQCNREAEGVGIQGERIKRIPYRRIDARKHIVIPGLINTHHHMFQSLTRAVPAAQNAELFDWLKALYPIWQGITPNMVRVSTQIAMAELLLSGCTTSSDHLYIFPNGVTLDDQVDAARAIGMRFHASRGAMSVGESKGGLPPDRLVERENDILDDMQSVAERLNDANEGSMHVLCWPLARRSP
jgi:cytosine/adenosine deaminase-related metal-dependent hydrolase